jgi:spermidine synthase
VGPRPRRTDPGCRDGSAGDQDILYGLEIRPILEVIVFISGGVLLALEIIASRVLAPYFGNSIYVWGSLIGVFLMALSAGYTLGGRLADRYPSPTIFAGVVFLAGLLIVPIPFVASPVLDAIARAGVGPQLGSLLAAVALFFVPSVVMGMVSPFAIRLRAEAISTVGRTAGALYTISTLGSIAGTLAASFFLINYFGVQQIIHLLSFALMIVAVLGWLWARRLLAAGRGIVLVALLGAGVTWTAVTPDAPVIYARDTAYQRITVSDEGPIRYLRLDNHWQSALNRDRPETTPAFFGYVDYMHLPLIFNSRPGRVSMLGLGGGTVARRYVADYPTVLMEVAEIDPAVVAVAQQYFGVRASEQLQIEARDGRLHLQLAEAPRDIILTDAYVKDRIPFHLATREFFALAHSRLAPDGILAANVIGALEGPDSRLFRAIYKTIHTVFPTVYVFPVEWRQDSAPGQLRNIILIATDQTELSADEIVRRAQVLLDQRAVTVDRFLGAAKDLYQRRIPTGDVPVLSDDFAPVDSLIAGQ